MALTFEGGQRLEGLDFGMVRVRVAGAGLRFYGGGVTENELLRLDTSGVSLRSGANNRIEVDGTGIGFFGIAPVARATAYTQTYSTADKTLASTVGAALSGITSSTAGTALAEPGGTYAQAEHQQNYRRLQDRDNELRTDLLDVAQMLNSVIDDLQAYGLLQ